MSTPNAARATQAVEGATVVPPTPHRGFRRSLAEDGAGAAVSGEGSRTWNGHVDPHAARLSAWAAEDPAALLALLDSPERQAVLRRAVVDVMFPNMDSASANTTKRAAQ